MYGLFCFFSQQFTWIIIYYHSYELLFTIIYYFLWSQQCWVKFFKLQTPITITLFSLETCKLQCFQVIRSSSRIHWATRRLVATRAATQTISRSWSRLIIHLVVQCISRTCIDINYTLLLNRHLEFRQQRQSSKTSIVELECFSWN